MRSRQNVELNKKESCLHSNAIRNDTMSNLGQTTEFGCNLAPHSSQPSKFTQRKEQTKQPLAIQFKKLHKYKAES